MFCTPRSDIIQSFHNSAIPPAQLQIPNPMQLESGKDASKKAFTASNKPRCPNPVCKGRQFSTDSNLLRHEREQHGPKRNYTCELCNAGFSRSTAKNNHRKNGACRIDDKGQMDRGGSATRQDPQKRKRYVTRARRKIN